MLLGQCSEKFELPAGDPDNGRLFLPDRSQDSPKKTEEMSPFVIRTMMEKRTLSKLLADMKKNGATVRPCVFMMGIFTSVLS
jgi:hypothetical protein